MLYANVGKCDSFSVPETCNSSEMGWPETRYAKQFLMMKCIEA
jgi:hypothetical protein